MVAVSPSLFAPVPPEFSWFAARVCASAGNGLKCVLNTHRKSLWFFWRTPMVGVHEEPMACGPAALGEVQVSAAVASIKGSFGQPSDSVEKRIEARKRERERVAAEWHEKKKAEIADEAVKRWKFGFDRIGMSGSRTVVIDGGRRRRPNKES